MGRDKIHLHHMTFYGYHGVYEEERRLGQKIVIDMDLYLDLAAAGESDDLTQTLDYTQVYRLTRRVVEEKQFNLLEALATAVAQEMLQLEKVRGVTVRVRKMAVPLSQLAYVEVEISRGDTF